MQVGSLGGTHKAVLLTVSGVVPGDIREQIDQGLRPRADFLELARGLDADIIDYAAARTVTGYLGAVLERLGGASLMLAYACWRLRKHYRVVVTDGEQVGVPLAAMLKFTLCVGPCHVMIVHVMSVPKKMIFLDWLGVQSHIDRFLVYSRWQQKFIEHRWKLAEGRVIWTPFMVDQKFFAPESVQSAPTLRPQICSVGMERRDYPTLLKAVEGLDVQVVIAAASPWSKYKDTTTGQLIPDNVKVRKFSQYELRQLYSDSRFLVMPLEPVEFQAGVTAILEAMAMAKPIICSGVVGQTDAVREGDTGRYVPPGDPLALRTEIVRMLAEPEQAAQLGAAGRQRVEREMGLDLYVERIGRVVRDTIAEADVAQGAAHSIKSSR